MDLRESMRDSTKFFREGLCVQLAAKLFCLETFMAYGTSLQWASNVTILICMLDMERCKTLEGIVDVHAYACRQAIDGFT